MDFPARLGAQGTRIPAIAFAGYASHVRLAWTAFFIGGNYSNIALSGVTAHIGPMLDKLRRLLFRSAVKKRQEPREEVTDGWVEIRGKKSPVKDWSARGFLTTSCDVDCSVTNRLDIRFSVPLTTGPLEFDCRAIVIRVDKDKRELACVFAMVDDATQAAIAGHFGLESAS